MHGEIPKDSDDEVLRGLVRVVAVRGDKAWVVAEAQSACGGCAAASGCGTKTLMSFLGKKSPPLEIDNVFDGVIGDRLEVGVGTGAMLKAAALLYLVPLLGLCVGAIAGGALELADTWSLFFGLAGLAAGFLVCHRVQRSQEFRTALRPRFLRKLAPVANCETVAIQVRA